MTSELLPKIFNESAVLYDSRFDYFVRHLNQLLVLIYEILKSFLVFRAAIKGKFSKYTHNRKDDRSTHHRHKISQEFMTLL